MNHEQHDDNKQLHRSVEVKEEEGESIKSDEDTTTTSSLSDIKEVGRAAALSVVAINGGALANAEALRIQELMGDLADVRLKRLERRIKQLDTLQYILDREAVQIEADRMELLTAQARVWMHRNSA